MCPKRQIRKMPQQHHSQALKHEDPRVAYLLDRLERTPERPLDLKALARSVRLSVRQVQRIFKATTGNTISAFLKELRLKQAADLLLNGYELVSQIAYSLGYTTHEHFTRDFTAFFWDESNRIQKAFVGRQIRLPNLDNRASHREKTRGDGKREPYPEGRIIGSWVPGEVENLGKVEGLAL